MLGAFLAVSQTFHLQKAPRRKPQQCQSQLCLRLFHWSQLEADELALLWALDGHSATLQQNGWRAATD